MTEGLLKPTDFHRPVLLAETTALLGARDGGVYFDGTLGGGGHAEAILRGSGPTGRLYATDRDPDAIETASARLAGYGERFHAALAAFDEIDDVEALRGLRFDGIVLDLGVSSHQLDTPGRGFSFGADGADSPLDMRMGAEGPTAADLLNELSVPDLAEIFRRYGEEPFAGPVARAVSAARPVTTAGELKAVLRSAVPPHFRPVKVYARAFQALRIAVNDELARLEAGLPLLLGRLRDDGRLAVLSYHSLEDRIVKRAFRAGEGECVCPPGLPVCACGRTATVRSLTRRPVRPRAEEIAENPRARSARLRVVCKLPRPADHTGEGHLPGPLRD